MKKLLSLVLVLAMASMAFAVSGPIRFEVDPADASGGYLPSDVITINVVSDILVQQLLLDNIIDDAGGAASGPLTLHAGFVSGFLPLPGTIVNSGGVLISSINGQINFLADLVDGVLYSFEYHVPNVEPSTIITIATGAGVNEAYDTNFSAIAVDSLAIHVIPEPMTIALLGLGGLFLRRRK